ncbi:hypothetical protein FB451DRAFT_1476292 [Mycena latifolia]|nr:hypothetical protein FB451DRAFT_1476292 [Mycena latifolia]
MWRALRVETIDRVATGHGFGFGGASVARESTAERGRSSPEGLYVSAQCCQVQSAQSISSPGRQILHSRAGTDGLSGIDLCVDAGWRGGWMEMLIREQEGAVGAGEDQEEDTALRIQTFLRAWMRGGDAGGVLDVGTRMERVGLRAERQSADVSLHENAIASPLASAFTPSPSAGTAAIGTAAAGVLACTRRVRERQIHTGRMGEETDVRTSCSGACSSSASSPRIGESAESDSEADSPNHSLALAVDACLPLAPHVALGELRELEREPAGDEYRLFWGSPHRLARTVILRAGGRRFVRGAGAHSGPGVGESEVEADKAEWEGEADGARCMTKGVVKETWKEKRSGRTPHQRGRSCLGARLGGPTLRPHGLMLTDNAQRERIGRGRRRTVSFGITCPPSQSTPHSTAEWREGRHTVSSVGADTGSRRRAGEACRAWRAHASNDVGTG